MFEKKKGLNTYFSDFMLYIYILCLYVDLIGNVISSY